jgi:integrase
MRKKGKRGKREGNIRKRDDGRYEGRVLLGFRDGKPVRPSFYGDTREKVRKEIQKAVRDWERGLIVGAGSQTLEQFLNAWVEDTAKPRLRPRTYEGYKRHVEKNIVPLVGSVSLKTLTPQHVQRMLNEKAAEGLAPRTVAGIRAVLRAALNDAVAWSLLDRNPAQHARPPRAQRAEAVTLSPEQAKKLLDKARDHWLGPFISVALAVGLRLGEGLGLGWDAVNLEGKTLRIVRALQRVSANAPGSQPEDARRELVQVHRERRKSRLEFVEPKSKTSRRTIRLPDFAVKALREHRIAQKVQRLAAGGEWIDTGLVFTTATGAALDDSKVRKEFKELLKKAELPDMRLHDLRHTCATLLIAQGVHPRVVMETLGHSQISITMDLYSHVTSTMQAEAAAKMDAAIG